MVIAWMLTAYVSKVPMVEANGDQGCSGLRQESSIQDLKTGFHVAKRPSTAI